MDTSPPSAEHPPAGLSPEKREDIWALLIALVVLMISLWGPEAVYGLFSQTLILF